MSEDAQPLGRHLPRWLIYLVILGLYLTLRGYHSFDGDQAYRLPLLLHRQDSRLFAGDPFVHAFDAFNPHRGSLLALDLVTRPLGLSAGLFVMFVLTFVASCAGIDRLARGTWPLIGPSVGLVAVGLVLAAKAGNIGTNHLFEAMVLDRLMALALGWLALAEVVVRPARGRWRAAAAVGAATLVHPSVGLQLAMVLAASWLVWCIMGRWMEVDLRTAVLGLLGLAAAVLPGLAVNLTSGPSLLGDMPVDVFWLLSVELQSPQHMLPHLWRMPQWLAWGCYLVLAALAMLDRGRPRTAGPPATVHAAMSLTPWVPARLRLTGSLAIILAGLGAAWLAIEVRHQVRVTVFQPFRMATVARGIALVMLAGRLVMLWRSGGWLGRTRATLLAVGLTGDWLLVVVTLAELAVSATQAIRTRLFPSGSWRFVDAAVLFGMLALGLNFLAHHDTEYGHIPLLAASASGLLIGLLDRWRPHVRSGAGQLTWSQAHMRGAFALAWTVPLASLLANAVPQDCAASHHPLVRSLIGRCRFMAVPADDVERLALWCRDHTPSTARFIGPPGPKTFRLWSLRPLAFNRAASPYHAAGLADWFARFQDHVGFHGSPEQFVRSYQADRHGFEARYQALGDAERASLALRQGATHVVAAAPQERRTPSEIPEAAGPLELLHVEGHHAVYRVKPAQLVQRQQ
ncbi:MAG: DUF6798 domain-containing protein [Isosphaerales bacterium]